MAANLDITVDANLTTMTSLDRTNDRLIITDAGTGTLQDIAPKTLMPDFPAGFADNYSLSVSVSSNNITLALKDASGNDPSPASPVKIRIGTNVLYVTSPLSVTVNAGASTFNAGSSELKTQLVNYFVYLGYRVSDTSVFISFARIPFGRTYADFSSTATNEKYLAYSGAAPASTDVVVNVGRFSATNSGTASFNWSISGSGDVYNFPKYDTDWLSWQPTFTASGSMTYGTVTTTQAIYKIVGDSVTVQIDLNGTTGGTASFGINISAPMKMNTTKAPGIPYLPCYVVDTTKPGGYLRYASASFDGIQAERLDEANWGLGAGRIVRGSLIYAL